MTLLSNVFLLERKRYKLLIIILMRWYTIVESLTLDTQPKDDNNDFREKVKRVKGPYYITFQWFSTKIGS